MKGFTGHCYLLGLRALLTSPRSQVLGLRLVRSEHRCGVCGALGHLGFECPDSTRKVFDGRKLPRIPSSLLLTGNGVLCLQDGQRKVHHMR
eukprot:3167412-Amphidinium_carterae.2